MDDYRSVKLKSLLKGCRHKFYVMTVYRSYISNSQILEEHSRHKHLLDGILRTLNTPGKLLSCHRNMEKYLLHSALDLIVCLSYSESAEVSGHATYILIYRHFIII